MHNERIAEYFVNNTGGVEHVNIVKFKFFKLNTSLCYMIRILKIIDRHVEESDSPWRSHFPPDCGL